MIISGDHAAIGLAQFELNKVAAQRATQCRKMCMRKGVISCEPRAQWILVYVCSMRGKMDNEKCIELSY